MLTSSPCTVNRRRSLVPTAPAMSRPVLIPHRVNRRMPSPKVVPVTTSWMPAAVRTALAAWSEVPQRDLRSGPRVYDRLESAFAALDRARDFESFLRELLEQHSDDVGARRALGKLLVTQGDLDAGITEFRRLQGPDVDDLGARAALGRILLAHGRQEEAMQEYGVLIDALEKRGLLDVREKIE